MQFEFMQIIYIVLGFGVGVISSCLGFGGGFMITPALFALGLPMNLAVGTSIVQTIGIAIVSSIRHKGLGNVDVKLGLMMLVGAIFGVESGAYLVQYLNIIKKVDLALGLTYTLLIGLLSIYMIREAHEARKVHPENDHVLTFKLKEKVQSLKLRPMISLSKSRIRSISLWVIMAIGYTIGFFAGLLGAGGGSFGVPLLIYAIGAPTTIAIGTQLFMIIFSSSYGAITHFLKGNVSITIASTMLIGTLIGACIGPMATKYFRIPNLRFLFGIVLMLTSFSTFCRIIGIFLRSFLLMIISQAIIFGAIGVFCCLILLTIFIKRHY